MLKSFRTCLINLLPYFCFLIVALVAWRDVLMTPGVVGHAWDWDIPALAPQLLTQISRWFFVWDYQFRGGFYSPYRPEGLYWALTLPLAFFGGEVFSKTIPLLLMLGSASSMYQLARRVLHLDAFWGTLAGILYMLSPAFYSRLIAGHMHILSPYSVLPLLFLFAWRAFDSYRARRCMSLFDVVGTGICLGLTGIHPSIVAIALVIVAVIVVIAVLRSGIRREIVLSGILIGILFSLISAFWAIPSGVGYVTEGAIFHSGWPLQQPDIVTPASVLIKQEILNHYAIQSVRESLRGYSTSSINTEFSYPISPELNTLWTLTSFLMPMLAFSTLLVRREDDEPFLALAILGLLGATLVSGITTAPGAAIAQFLLKYLLPVWEEFANTVRWLPLVAFANAALVPGFMQRMSGTLKPRYLALGIAGTIVVAVYTSPFWMGNLLNPKDPFALRMYQPAADDQMLYDFLSADIEDFRVTYVAPPWQYNAEDYDLGYAWNGGLSLRPEFLRPYYEPDPWAWAATFGADLRPSLSGDMLGLAAVKYIVYPREKFIHPYLRVLPRIPNNYSSSAKFVEQTLESQKNLVRVTVPSTQTLVLRNEAYLPRIYAADNSVLVHSGNSMLPVVASSSFFRDKPALFIETQQPAGTLGLLARQTDVSLMVSFPEPNTRATDPHTAWLLPIPLFDETERPFTSASSQSLIRIKAAPFRTFKPSSSDVSAAVFDPPSQNTRAAWSGNAQFSYRVTADGLHIAAYLNSTSRQSEYVEWNNKVEPIDLTQYPYLRLTTLVENPEIQSLVLKLGLDWDGDGSADDFWTSPAFTHAKLKSDDVNVLELVKHQFPEQPQYHVVQMVVQVQKNNSQTRSASDYGPTLYDSVLHELGLYSDAAMTRRGFALSFPDEPDSGVATLHQTASPVDLARDSIQVAFHVDGPARLYSTWQLIAQDANGTTRTLDAGTRMLEPFSQGTIQLDVRDMLSRDSFNHQDCMIQVSTVRLIGERELRPTTLTLTQAGVAWSPTTEQHVSPTPTLILDGKPVALQPPTQDVLHERLEFETDALGLSAGAHRVSVSFGDASAFVPEFIEIERATKPQKPTPPQVTFRRITPTRYVAHVDNATAPFFLVFSESFQSDWQAYRTSSSKTSWYESSALLSWFFDNTKHEEITEHVRANGFANAWYLDTTGNYDVVLEFIPQRIYEAGWIISLGTLAGCGVFLIASAKRGTR